MTFLTIGSGSSVKNYPLKDLEELAKNSLTIAVNDSSFNFSCDLVCAGDYEWIINNYEKLRVLGKPVITREWDILVQYPLDYILLPNNVCNIARLSGMIAAKIQDSIANRANRISFVIGLDHTKGHYYDSKSDCRKVVTDKDYTNLKLKNTINLGGKVSKITAWPKQQFLPKSKPRNMNDKDFLIDTIRAFHNELIRDNI